MHRFANPTRFFRIANALLPVLGAVSAGLFAAGLYYALFDSPADYQQGETVRIMYVHVPAAWAALACYATMALAGASFLIWKHILADLAARAAAPIGAGFTLISLATGSLWGQPMWGTWWVWDARLTSVLILFFLYLGYIALVNAFDDQDRGGRAGAVLALVGAVNLPIIKFSVDWWNTLHQPASVLRMDGPSIAPEMLLPLMLMASAYFSLFGVMMILRLRSLYAGRRLRQMRLAAAAR
ncbi:heme ABC transporter permease [Thalassobaculum sp. OXR-137]|uniref:heme ABC transporter permease n=1 Tax=Thalassobaculum sp. OXR-137 TaxID=3100173 RepID=UPI002AC9BFAF|nr:heme ABC transporter permease [Thalassobaculum sp. OXR-137]WPZ36023.1 heme ABC transporter permease [Thalassobaculum sp. OXR-137]